MQAAQSLCAKLGGNEGSRSRAIPQDRPISEHLRPSCLVAVHPRCNFLRQDTEWGVPLRSHSRKGQVHSKRRSPLRGVTRVKGAGSSATTLLQTSRNCSAQHVTAREGNKHRVPGGDALSDTVRAGPPCATQAMRELLQVSEPQESYEAFLDGRRGGGVGKLRTHNRSHVAHHLPYVPHPRKPLEVIDYREAEAADAAAPTYYDTIYLRARKASLDIITRVNVKELEFRRRDHEADASNEGGHTLKGLLHTGVPLLSTYRVLATLRIPFPVLFSFTVQRAPRQQAPVWFRGMWRFQTPSLKRALGLRDAVSHIKKTLVVNCTMECGEIVNNSLPCVNVTYPPLNFSNPQLNYTCTVGNCVNGTCPSNGTNMTCWAEFDKWVLGSLSNTSPITLL
ncbi:hypothetical protein MRX96_018059 [Rhipicephalus microplus]